MKKLFEKKFRPHLKEGLEGLYDLYVYIDGLFLKRENAKISVFDHGLLYSDGVFEGIRVYEGLLFKLDDHLDRLYDSAKAIDLEIPLTKEEIKEVVVETVKMNKLRNAHVRPIVTRGFGLPGFDPRRSVRPTIIVMAYPFPPLLGEKGLRLLTSSIRRRPPDVLDCKIKTLHYVNSILAKVQANALGVDDAIMFDTMGLIAELCTENIFMIKKGVVYTPFTTSCLEGITRETVISLGSELGYEIHEKNVTLHELYCADEAFATGTGAEILPIIEVDGRKIGTEAIGPITRNIRDAYHKLVRNAQSPYTTPVYPDKQ